MFEWFQSWFTSVSTDMINLLPGDPFENVINSITTSSFSEVLGWLNWCLPMRNVANLLMAYVVAKGSIIKFMLLINWSKLFKS